MFGLDQFDIDALLLALASELDLRYERLFGYLQDDVTRKRPTVDLILSLLCPDDGERLALRARFAADAPLLRHGLIRLAADPNFLHPPMLAQFVSPDEQVLWFLLGTRGLHSGLAASCMVEQDPSGELDELLAPPDTLCELERAAAAIAAKTTTLALWLHSPGGDCAVDAGRALAEAGGVPLILLDATRVPAQDAESTLRRALREARFRGALLCIVQTEIWLDEPFASARLAALLREPTCPTLLGSARAMPTELLGVALPIDLPLPDATQRERGWHAALAQHGAKLQEAETAALAKRFRLTAAQIAAAVSDGCLRSHGAGTFESMQAAARAQTGEALARVADKVDAKATWDDLVLPADAIAQLHEICNRVEHHDRVFIDWGFRRKLSRGRGTTALFTGGSGTGKTMAAEVVANALGLDLYRIDLARVVNKYIGETEKNLDRVFAAAEGANAILFFDEADALFGKRSEVKDAHDRYANIEVSYLLQRMEEYEGVAILASNLADNLDDAFTRRLAFSIHFPFPDVAARCDIWRHVWPPEVQLGEDLDLYALASEFKLSGGNIASAALAACFATQKDQPLQRTDVLRALKREFEKLSRRWPLGDPHAPAQPVVRQARSV